MDLQSLLDATNNSIKGQSEGLSTRTTDLAKKVASGSATSAEAVELRKLIKIQEKALKQQDKYNKEQKAASKELEKQIKDQLKENNKEAAKRAVSSENILKSISSGLDSMFRTIDNNIKLYTQYSIKVNSALEGTQKTYQQAVQNLTDAIGSTGLAKMSDVLSQMNALTSDGLVANVEEHAFLNSIKDGISSVFDSANGTLVRLIKLQGEDSTVNRLVMQASLKEYLNETYQNSQYLYNQFDTVSGNLLEATSLLTSTLSSSLEATVQKWLGSLSSLGLSDQAVGSLSSALGAVGSGNLRGINQNMQNLVIMGANRAGLSYSDLLTGGLSSEQTNALMYGMIDYLGSLRGNNVVMSEYANIFGMNVSDLVAARNAQSRLGTIAGTPISSDRSGLGKYLQNYNNYLNATPAALYDTLFGNMLFGMGANVAGDRGSYALYKAGGLVSSITSGLGLSGVAGNAINLIGPGIQLAAALGGGPGGFSITNIGKTMSGLISSASNLWKSPDAMAAYATLSGTSPTAGILGLMGAALGARAGASALVSTSSSGGSTGSGAFGDTNSVTANIDAAWAEAESQIAAEKTINDIYDFLERDVVQVTPYVTGEDILTTVAGYNRITAEKITNIWQFFETELRPYLAIEMAPEFTSLQQTKEGKDMLATLGFTLS